MKQFVQSDLKYFEKWMWIEKYYDKHSILLAGDSQSQ